MILYIDIVVCVFFVKPLADSEFDKNYISKIKHRNKYNEELRISHPKCDLEFRVKLK
jgi:hypothetical protein